MDPLLRVRVRDIETIPKHQQLLTDLRLAWHTTEEGGFLRCPLQSGPVLGITPLRLQVIGLGLLGLRDSSEQNHRSMDRRLPFQSGQDFAEERGVIWEVKRALGEVAKASFDLLL